MPAEHPIDRRRALERLAGGVGLASLSTAAWAAAEPPPPTGLGLVIYDCGLRRRWQQGQDSAHDLFEPLAFLQHCHRLGAGGMQAALGVLDADRVRALRDYAEQHGLFIEAIVGPPRDAADAARFDAEIQSAAAVGALAARTVVIPGRRYEQFHRLADFRAAETLAQQMLERAAPVVERRRVRLAVENHKDQRIDERLALYKRLDSEYIGACVDTGNSFALLDDPYEAVAALAPYAFSVHLKDQAVREYDDGFLLGDIPLGGGCFDLPRMVATLRQARPELRFVLEIITRDPLKVPCLTPGYWETLPTVPGRDLARTLRLVRGQNNAVQQVSSLSLPDQVALEDANIRASLAYARTTLRL